MHRIDSYVYIRVSRLLFFVGIFNILFPPFHFPLMKISNLPTRLHIVLQYILFILFHLASCFHPCFHYNHDLYPSAHHSSVNRWLHFAHFLEIGLFRITRNQNWCQSCLYMSPNIMCPFYPSALSYTSVRSQNWFWKNQERVIMIFVVVSLLFLSDWPFWTIMVQPWMNERMNEIVWGGG